MRMSDKYIDDCTDIPTYLSWLIDICGLPQYSLMLSELYNIEFFTVVENDSNRVTDAEMLIYSYALEYSLDVYPSVRDIKASVLEVIVALGKRCEDDIMSNSEDGDRTSEWVTMMLDNLGLLEYSDEEWQSDFSNCIRIIINKFLNRTYHKDGTNGGMFPIPGINKNMRKTDLWYQMNWYLEVYNC